MKSTGKEIASAATLFTWTMLMREQVRHPNQPIPEGLIVVYKDDLAQLIDEALSDKDQQIKALIDVSGGACQRPVPGEQGAENLQGSRRTESAKGKPA